MYTFYMKLAEVTVMTTCNYKETMDFCADYLIDMPEQVQIRVQVTLQDLAVERELARKEYGEGEKQFSNAYLETLAVYRQIADQLPAYGIILFHGSVVSVDEKAYLFTAPSGTGKSTHTRLWREVFGDRAFMVNDDKPLLYCASEGKVIAYGTPWDGKHKLSRNVGVPLQGICILKRGTENRIRKMTQGACFVTMFQQTYRSTGNPETMKQTLHLLNCLVDVGVWELECNISYEAVKLSYEAMSGKELKCD